MYEILKAIAAANAWGFNYGRSDFQNLIDEFKTAPKQIFLDPVKISEEINEEGETEAFVYSGSFMLLISSDIDEESYNYRYENYIKPFIYESTGIIKTFIACETEAKINKWGLIEVINIFDWNADGLIIDYQLTENV